MNRILLLLACLLWNWPAHGQITLKSGTVIRFATLAEARAVLGTRDDFVQRMSPFDRAARLKTDRTVAEAEYLAFSATNAVAWTDAEQKKLTTALAGLQGNLDALPLTLPKEVLLIKTTGAEEGDAAYTRTHAIMLPASDVKKGAAGLRKILAHELFHVLSRANPALRGKLYGVIGYVPCEELPFPAELLARKITNPDAPLNNHCIKLTLDGKEVWAVPILFARVAKYDPSLGGEFFQYLDFKMVVVEREGKAVKPVVANGKARLADLKQFSGFFEQVGRNTQYVIHPEETLADNFALLVTDDHSAPNPEIVQKLKAVLVGK
jgi:hypothetical protein